MASKKPNSSADPNASGFGGRSRTLSSRPSDGSHWHNTHRLHGFFGDIPPAEFEPTLYAGQTNVGELVGIIQSESPSDTGLFILRLTKPSVEIGRVSNANGV